MFIQEEVVRLFVYGKSSFKLWVVLCRHCNVEHASCLLLLWGLAFIFIFIFVVLFRSNSK